MRDEYLWRLYECANDAVYACVKAADQGKFDTQHEAVNWGDLGCTAAERVVDNFGANYCRVIIEEVSPGANKFHKFISDYMKEHGFPDVEVVLEW
jgi:hypothetical protein